MNDVLERLNQKVLARETRKRRIEVLRALVIANSIITTVITVIVSVLAISYSYDFRGYFAIGGEYIIIAAFTFLTPVVLWSYERWFFSEVI